MKNFGEFFNNQIEYANTIILSRTQKISEKKLEDCVAEIREHNESAAIITTPWEEITGKQIVDTMEKKNSLSEELLKEAEICPCCGHHHDHDHDHCEHDHHDHDHDHCKHDHHDHDYGHCNHDHHDHDHGHCDHDHHDHDHCDHHHHADDVFTSWGIETPHKFETEEMNRILEQLANTEEFGVILRAKGIVPNVNGEWIYFDLVPGEYELRTGEPDYTGRLCVIGTKLQENKIKELFHVA